MEGVAVCACGSETSFSTCERCANGLGVKWAGLPGKLCEPCLTDGIDNAIRDFR